jgi:SAM-dependent methyltransferase
MSHFQQLEFFRICTTHFPEYFRGKRVLEVGSWIANDSIRKFFIDCDYVGADVAAGPGVDVVCAGQELDFDSEHFEVVVSTECFEHNPQWVETFSNMYRMLSSPGLFIMTCAAPGRAEHGTVRSQKNDSLTALAGFPDYYKNLSRRDFETNFPLTELFSEHAFSYNAFHRDIYFIGLKGKHKDPSLVKKLTQELNAVTTLGKQSYALQFATKAKFWYCFLLSRVLGEDRYHKVRHLRRSILELSK